MPTKEIKLKKRFVQVGEGHYASKYESLPMWINHWHQIQEIVKLGKSDVLEIGPGNGIVSYFLRKCGLNVCTSDIDPRNNPDVICDVTNTPFGDGSADVVLCCEVLEHIPYSEFAVALKETHRVSRQFAVISLPAPFVGAAWTVNFPRLRIFKLHIGEPFIAKKEFDGEHYWELGRLGYPLRRIRKSIDNRGFKIVREFRPPLSLFCCFFALEKR